MDASSTGLVEDQRVAPRSHRAHGLEAVLRHVAVQLDAVAVGIGEIDAAADVVLDGGFDGNPHRFQIPMRGLQLLEAPELPGHVVHAGLGRLRRLAGGQLEQGQIVVLLTEAQKDGAMLQVLVGDLHPQRLGVEVPGPSGVPHLEHDVTELAGLNHDVPPGAPSRRRASSRSVYFWTLPVAVVGSGPKTTVRGTAKWGRLSRQKRISSSSVAFASGRSCTKAQGVSPHFSSGRATTADIITAGCRFSAISTSILEMFSPPEMMMSLDRSLISMYPSGCCTARSPVWNHPPSNAASVAARSLR